MKLSIRAQTKRIATGKSKSLLVRNFWTGGSEERPNYPLCSHIKCQPIHDLLPCNEKVLATSILHSFRHTRQCNRGTKVIFADLIRNTKPQPKQFQIAIRSLDIKSDPSLLNYSRVWNHEDHLVFFRLCLDGRLRSGQLLGS